MTVSGGFLSQSHDLPHDIEATVPENDDVALGSYLISHLRSHCESCGVFQTPQWRKGWFSDVLNHSVLLCNACGLKFHKGQFCPYCKYVYGKEQRIPEDWMNCHTCGRWVHSECERSHGKHQDDAVYACPDCRNGIPSTYFARTSELMFNPHNPSKVSSRTRASSKTQEISSADIQMTELSLEDPTDIQIDDDEHTTANGISTHDLSLLSTLF